MSDTCCAPTMDFVRPVQAVIPGVPGRVLAVLAEVTVELSLRSIARVAGVSLAQASRVLPHLVELGLVERREVPPSTLFRLVPNHVTAGPLLDLARSRARLLEMMRTAASELAVVPASVVVFGSFARGEADEGSDIDVLLVRAAGVVEDDPEWAASAQSWKGAVRRASGNRVDSLEVGAAEVAARLGSGRQVWRDIRRSGVAIYGLSLEELAGSAIDA